MARILRYALFGILATGLFSQVTAVSLSNREGKVIEVDILDTNADQIQIRLENGQVIWFDRALLSDESQVLISTKESEGKDLYKEINARLGIELFNDNSLWDDKPSSVAKRLKWPQESKTDTQSSYRSYPKSDYRILESRPYSAALYGDNGATKHLSIVFANKGDYKFSPEPTAGEISDMERAIDQDVDRIQSQLTEQLGEPDRQQFGSGRGMKQLIQRWDWKGHAFLLASQDGEYASLKIMSTTMADNKGRSEKLSDAALRAITSDYLIQRENGDNIVGNIPMVNQGPKGYCVPATFERYLRYMQIPADMYILAMAGQTSVGGGTSLSAIIESIDGYISSQNRSMKKLQEPIKVRTVQKHIDKGLPIIWTMFSSREYNNYANERTKARQEVTDWEAWEKHVKSDARSTNLIKDINTAHACMIVGYNKETEEIAVSDSWGPSYRERWISAEQAEQVSQGSIYVIGF
ncbi:MAG: C39 family peptidase [Opitutaceae bacterium]